MLRCVMFMIHSGQYFVRAQEDLLWKGPFLSVQRCIVVILDELRVNPWGRFFGALSLSVEVEVAVVVVGVAGIDDVLVANHA